jgi:hypothetical protein
MLLTCAGCARVCVTGDLTKMRPEYQGMSNLPGMAWTKHAMVCQMGTYNVTVPVDPNVNAIWVARNGQPEFMVYPEIGATVYQRVRPGAKAELALTLSDFNGDGLYDRLGYTTFDDEGRPVADIFDMNLDGEPDFKFVRADNRMYVHLDGQWVPVEKGRVLIGGVWKKVTWNGQRPSIQE